MSREVTGIMGIGKESSYDTAVSPTHIFHSSEARHGSRMAKFDEGETVNGFNHSTGLTPTQDLSRPRINTVAHDEAVACLLAASHGADAVTTPSGATAARQHKITPFAVSGELASYTIQSSVTTVSETTVKKATRYSGCLCDTFTMSGSVRDKVVRISTEFAASGTRAAGVDLSAASRPNFGPHIFNNIFLFVGVSYTAGSLNLPVFASSAEAPDGAEIGSAVNLSTYIRGFTYSRRNNIDQEGGHAGSTGLVATSMFSGKPEMTLSLTLRFDDTVSALLDLIDGDGDYWRSMALCCWSNTKIEDVTTDYQHAFSGFFPRAEQNSEPQWNSTNLGVREFTIDFLITEDQTNNAAEWYVWNKDATDHA